MLHYFNGQGDRVSDPSKDQAKPASMYFDGQGNGVSNPPIPQTSFEDFVITIPPGEEKDTFLRFILEMLAWDPETQATANEMIQDEQHMQSVEMSRSSLRRYTQR